MIYSHAPMGGADAIIATSGRGASAMETGSLTPSADSVHDSTDASVTSYNFGTTAVLSFNFSAFSSIIFASRKIKLLS